MKKLFQTVCETPISAPKEAFNLHDWVFTLSDKVGERLEIYGNIFFNSYECKLKGF